MVRHTRNIYPKGSNENSIPRNKPTIDIIRKLIKRLIKDIVSALITTISLLKLIFTINCALSIIELNPHVIPSLKNVYMIKPESRYTAYWLGVISAIELEKEENTT
jgi:hypothetical protein